MGKKSENKEIEKENRYYKEIYKLRNLLLAHEFPFKWDGIYNGNQIIVEIKRKANKRIVESARRYNAKLIKTGSKAKPRSIYMGSRWISVIEHDYSVGHEKDKLEIFGGITRDEESIHNSTVASYQCLGNLDAKEVYKRIKYCIEHETFYYTKEE